MNKKILLFGTLTELMYYVAALNLLRSKDKYLLLQTELGICRIFKNFYE